MVHVCDKCQASFQRPSRLQVHMRTHTGERPFVCACGRSYIRRQHLTRHHEKCSGDVKASVKIAEKNSSKCGKNKSADYCCNQCGAGPFVKKKAVWAHLAIVHGERRFKCDQCESAFPIRSKLDRHLLRHHKLECTICKEQEPSKKQADKLNYIFENFVKLREHIATQHPLPDFRCSTCNQRFSRVQHLEEHRRIHQPGGLSSRRRFVCTICSPPTETGTNRQANNAPSNVPVAFTAKRNLIAHIKSLHGTELHRFACPFPDCTALLSNEQKLSVHLRRHSTNSSPVLVYSKKSRIQTRMNPPSTIANPIPKKRRCVPLSDLNEKWETESQSSVVSLLC